MHKSTVRLLCLAAASAVLAMSSGCAVLKEENRVLVSYLDEHVQPESTTARAALALPVAIGGTGALAIDAAIVHPVRSAPIAANDVYRFYWEKPAKLDALSRSLLFVPCAILTPPAFVLDWGLRCIFPIGD